MSTNKNKAGFTLIEMMAVIAVITLMAVVAIAATTNNVAGMGAKQGAIIASNILTLTRSEAVEKQGYAVLLIDAFQDANNPGNYLHRMMVVDASAIPGATGSNSVTQVSPWYDLPTTVYFDPTWSAPSSPVSMTINNASGQIFNGSAYVYTFTPAGQLASAGQLVVAVGHENSSTSAPLFEDGTSGTPDTRQGFFLHLLGRPSFFQSSSSIPSATH